MRHAIPIVMLLLSAASFCASAADPEGSCPLLGREELAALGVDEDTSFVDSDWDWEKKDIPKEVPESVITSRWCVVTLNKMGKQAVAMLLVDHFQGKATEAQVGNWYKATSAARKNDAEVTLVMVGETECETGNYELPTRQEDDSFSNVNELYVACDTQVGTRVISLNFHMPETSKGNLPTPEQTKAILDKSVQRLKEAALGRKT